MKIDESARIPETADRRAAIKAAKGFEAVFLKEMMKTAMPTSNREESLYGDMLADAFSQEAAAGKGIGLAEWIVKNGIKLGVCPT